MPISRSQNCYKHPKKFLWRSSIVSYNSAENTSDKSPIPDIASPEDKSGKMSPTLDDGLKPPVEPEPTSISRPSEEAPLDFSLKTKASELEVEQPKHSSPTVAFPGMMNGNHGRLPSPYNNLAYANSHDRPSHDRNSPDADWSQSSNDSTPRTDNGFDGKILKPSPGCPSAYSDDSPNRNPSLLQELLTTEQRERKTNAEHSNPLSPPFHHINGSHGIPGIPLFTGSSPPMVPPGPCYPLYKFMPQASPAFAFGYANPRAQLMPGYLPQFTESGFVESPAGRKTNKRKMDFPSDPFKSCSVEELQNNLRSIEIVNPYMSAMPPLSELISPGRLPSDQASTLSPSSQDSVRSAIDQHTANGKSASAPNSTSGTPAATHGNHSAINDNHSAVNGTPQTSSGNDSVSSAITESDKKEFPSDGRKRKTIPDSEKNEAYYARRSKNNEAARKSRETRRQKEELVKRLCTVLDSKNKALNHEMSLLCVSFEQAQRQNYALTTEIENLKIHNTLLMEKLKQKKCGQCGSTLPSVN